LFYDVLYDGIANGQAARINEKGKRDSFVSFFEFASYMRREISERSNHKMFPTPGALPPGGWQGAFVFATTRDATAGDAEVANERWKKLGGRKFDGQVTYVINRTAFIDEEIINGDGWFGKGTLVNRVESTKADYRVRPAKHIVIGYTFSPNGPTSKAGIRNAYVARSAPGSVHFVVYKDRSIDQFVSLEKTAWAIGDGNRRNIRNGDAISVWLDNNGVMSSQDQVDGNWQTFNNTSIADANVIKVANFQRLSRDLIDERSCSFRPVSHGWEKYELPQLEAAESVIDQVVLKLGLPKSRDTVVALSEIRCDKFAPGPQLNPWMTCIKDRVASGRSAGGCARETVATTVVQ
jgi:N-acetyl-anhydromuramyl-L-alanine amidase AmpD